MSSVIPTDINDTAPEFEHQWFKAVGQFDVDSNTRRKYLLSYLYPVSYEPDEHSVSASVDNITLRVGVHNYEQVDSHSVDLSVDMINLERVVFPHVIDAPIEEHEVSASVDSIVLRNVLHTVTAPIESHEATLSIDSISVDNLAVNSTVVEEHEVSMSVDSITLSPA